MAKRKQPPRVPDYDDYYFPRSTPLRTNDGLKSRNQRGAFASRWWGKRWLNVLESYGIGSRLERGRSYARSGQVLNIDVQSGLVTARVQGSRPTPYRVKIVIKALSDESWGKVLDAISTQAIFTAQLLDGVMPNEIEDAFEEAKAPLFPADRRTLTTDCTCPDDANPCKHIAAVYYLLGEQFDLDPFLIFTLRGRTRDQVMEGLRARRASAADFAVDDQPILAKVTPLSEQIETFWGPAEFEWAPLPLSIPETPGQALRRFNPPPHETQTSLLMIYQAMSDYVQRHVLGEE